MSTLGVVGDAQGVGIVWNCNVPYASYRWVGVWFVHSGPGVEWDWGWKAQIDCAACHQFDIPNCECKARFLHGHSYMCWLLVSMVHLCPSSHGLLMFRTFFGVMSSDNACLVRQPRVRVLKQIVASHRGFVSSLDGAPEGSLGSGPSSDSLAIADVENQDRMQFSIAVRMQINNI